MVNRGNASLDDVASLAGVSVTTASRALNGIGRVAPATRRRVIEVAERLNFRPNPLARSFATGRSGVLGVIVDELVTFSRPVFIAAIAELSRAGMATLIFDVHANRSDRHEAVRILNDRKVDGALVIGHANPYLEPSLFSDLAGPVVFAYGVNESPTAASFGTDGHGAGRIAGEHLVGLGRTRIAHITAAGDPSAALRATGLTEVLTEHGLRLVGGGPITGKWQRSTGEHGMAHLLDLGEPIDAVFCGNDQIAWGAYSVLKERGVAVPEDIAVMGYDHWTALLESDNAFLTTIDPKLEELGTEASRALLAALDGRPTTGHRLIPATLVPGVSTLGVDGYREATGRSSAGAEPSLELWISAIEAKDA